MPGQLTLAELWLEAEAMGLEGDDVVNFVYKQQELYRNEQRSVLRVQLRELRGLQQLRLSVLSEQQRLRERLDVRCVLQMHWRGREIKHESM